MTYCIIKAKYRWVHAFNLRTLLSSLQSQIRERSMHFQQNIRIIIIFTYIRYIIYSIYTYICWKCIKFLKISACTTLSETIFCVCYTHTIFSCLLVYCMRYSRIQSYSIVSFFSWLECVIQTLFENFLQLFIQILNLEIAKVSEWFNSNKVTLNVK